MVEVKEGTERARPMKPQCYMAMLYLNWVVYLGVIAWTGLTGRYFFSLAWALGFPLFMLAYMAIFPRFSRLLGYGSVEDKSAVVSGKPMVDPPADGEDGGAGEGSSRLPEVTLYKAVGCPFCPIVERRLDELEAEGGFTLRKIDVTLRPATLAAKGIKAVPVVEAGGHRLTGHATSQQLAALSESLDEPDRLVSERPDEAVEPSSFSDTDTQRRASSSPPSWRVPVRRAASPGFRHDPAGVRAARHAANGTEGRRARARGVDPPLRGRSSPPARDQGGLRDARP